MRSLPTNGKNKAKFFGFWDSGPSLYADHSFTSGLCEYCCFARGNVGSHSPLQRAKVISIGSHAGEARWENGSMIIIMKKEYISGRCELERAS